MLLYEFTFIAQQSLTQYELEGLIKGLSTLLIKVGAELIKYEYWGLLDFAYSIEKANKGHYCMMYISVNNFDVINEFKRKIRLNEDVIRFLCLRVNKIPKGNSWMVNLGKD
ncbi:30S ribosomal protein S6 [Neoehrlichia mikurensis]|uniref:Small ribosomal subunit protein bS6 n=1 Tax=Neoehrlichia mikurensis TaxID=89586 RepID=A0A9Q9F5D0_9RICK|nr:30S ribosomal protein S6 [Neoehrlichia mikurensis]QXK91718.1 30S ribosomal protein S6 [Neoehrlichia mikurensis]QXK92930.1 30S ribosomal protein S6 [Neoehrlichia mikurensis]QXK93408.1 30S ribosomal protein S6 [Neoehrlichia mikurensis]UTO55641.1 30S ribosomal protein S6 [Neoehrlichia mikurensis]UTO56561.1 30S ribosomal protein S6 [Neoehrlichia mikurensis]